MKSTAQELAQLSTDLLIVDDHLKQFKSNQAKRALQKLKIILNEAVSSYGKSY